MQESEYIKVIAFGETVNKTTLEETILITCKSRGAITSEVVPVQFPIALNIRKMRVPFHLALRVDSQGIHFESFPEVFYA